MFIQKEKGDISHTPHDTRVFTHDTRILTHDLIFTSTQLKYTLLRMRETYEKRMKINEIIFIQNEMKCGQRMSTVHLAYL